MIKEAATDPLAERFQEAGYSVLAFDFRRLGESGGRPRQIARMGEQQADWQAAIEFAETLPGVGAGRVAIWGFSLSGGHVFKLAARNPGLAAAIAHAPLADGVAATPLNGERALNPGDGYPQWQKEIAARSAVRLGFYRPARHAARVRCPLLVLVQEHDGVAPPSPAIRAGGRAPRGEVVGLPGGHYGAFLDQHEQAVDAMLDFLGRRLAARARPAGLSAGDCG